MKRRNHRINFHIDEDWDFHARTIEQTNLFIILSFYIVFENKTILRVIRSMKVNDAFIS
jgi:hypothetical protein